MSQQVNKMVRSSMSCMHTLYRKSPRKHVNMVICAVFGCSKKPVPGSGIHFYKLPNSGILSEWIRCMCRKDKLPKAAFICSNHFTEEDYKRNVLGNIVYGKRGISVLWVQYGGDRKYGKHRLFRLQ